MEAPELEMEATAALGAWYERYQGQARSLKRLASVFELLEQLGCGRAMLRADEYLIYALVDPFDGQVRYVGLTNDPARRLGEHQRDRDNYDKAAWVQRLALYHQRPMLRELERVRGEAAAHAAEAWWIAAYTRRGYRLLNAEPGWRQEKDA